LFQTGIPTKPLDIGEHPEFMPFMSMIPRPGALQGVVQKQP